MARKHDFGREGEEMGIRYLISRGYTIVARNYRYRKAEVDILALKDRILAVIEVKSRSGGFYESIEGAVSKRKRNLLVMAADHFVLSQEIDVEVRFDILTIIRAGNTFRITHYPDAFFPF